MLTFQDINLDYYIKSTVIEKIMKSNPQQIKQFIKN